jgi:hypothetical protein
MRGVPARNADLPLGPTDTSADIILRHNFTTGMTPWRFEGGSAL